MWKPTHVDVTVVRAKDLPVKGKGSNDVFAFIQLGKEKFKTSIREKTLTPEWNEECSFPIPPDLTKTVDITLYHRNLLSVDGKFLGRLSLPLEQLMVFRDKPHSGFYPLRGKDAGTQTKKKAKYRGEVLVTTCLVVRSDPTPLAGASKGGLAGNGGLRAPFGGDQLRRSSNNLFSKEKQDFPSQRMTVGLSEEKDSRQRLNRSNSLAALAVNLKRAVAIGGSKKKKGNAAADATGSINHGESTDEQDEESVSTRDEEADDFSAGLQRHDSSTPQQRKQYSLPRSVGAVGSNGNMARPPSSSGLNRVPSSAASPSPSKPQQYGGSSGGLDNGSPSLNNGSNVWSNGGGVQRQPSGRSNASVESGLSIDERSQSSAVLPYGQNGNTSPPKSSTLGSLTMNRVGSGTSQNRNSPSTAGVNGYRRPSTDNLNSSQQQTPSGTGLGGRIGSGAIPMGINAANRPSLSSISPASSNSTLIPSKVYEKFGKMSRDELLRVIAQNEIEIHRRDDYIDDMLARIIEKAPFLLQR